MELTNLPMFGIMRGKMSWLNQRQEVLARNIANSDTPDYGARDLQKFDARRVVERRPRNFSVNIAQTNEVHIRGRKSAGAGDFKEAPERTPYETAPAGNAVILEEQMIKVSETAINHQLVSQLYKKHLRMFRTVARGGGA